MAPELKLRCVQLLSAANRRTHGHTLLVQKLKMFNRRCQKPSVRKEGRECGTENRSLFISMCFGLVCCEDGAGDALMLPKRTDQICQGVWVCFLGTRSDLAFFFVPVTLSEIDKAANEIQCSGLCHSQLRVCLLLMRSVQL